MGPSDFIADRTKVKAGSTRDAWEALLYNMPETYMLSLGFVGTLPDGLAWPCRYMKAIESEEVFCDPHGAVYRLMTLLNLPSAVSKHELHGLHHVP